MRNPRPAASEDYTAPALEKGLDILELLADRHAGMTLRQMADSLSRTPSEIFRMAMVLVNRGYLHKREPGDVYELSSRLFELSHRHPPTRRLLDVTLPVMRELAEAIGQSCHLSVISGLELLVLAHVDSPTARSLVVRAGTRAPLLQTASGMILLAFADEFTREEILRQLPGEHGITGKLDSVRQRGFEQHRSRSLRGVIDFSAPALDHLGHAVAAITVPYLTPRHPETTPEQILHHLRAAAARASADLGYRENPA